MPEITRNWFNSCNRPKTWKRVLGLFIGKPNINFLEIGSFEGASAIWLLNNILTHPTSRLTCLDAWQPFSLTEEKIGIKEMKQIESRFDKNMKPYEGRFSKLKSNSSQGLAKLMASEQKFEMVYVDGCHSPSQTITDIVMSYHLLKHNGCMIIDDYGSPIHNLKNACDVWIDEWKGRVSLIERDHQLIVRKEVRH